MSSFKSFGDLSGHIERVVCGERTRPQPLSERFAVDELEHQELGVVRFLQPINSGNVWMVERGKHLRFATEARHAFWIDGEGLGENLQRDFTTEVRIARTIHLTHSAFAQ